MSSPAPCPYAPRTLSKAEAARLPGGGRTSNTTWKLTKKKKTGKNAEKLQKTLACVCLEIFDQSVSSTSSAIDVIMARKSTTKMVMTWPPVSTNLSTWPLPVGRPLPSQLW